MLTSDNEDQLPQRIHPASDYLAMLSMQSPRNTQKARAYDLASWFCYCHEQDIDWTQATGLHVASFVLALQTTPSNIVLGRSTNVIQMAYSQARTGTAVKRILQSIKAFYTWAGDHELVSDSVVKRIKAIKSPKVAHTTSQTERLSKEQIKTL